MSCNNSWDFELRVVDWLIEDRKMGGEEDAIENYKLENERLRAEIAELRARVQNHQARPRITEMSAEVVDSNPYRSVFSW